MSESPTKPVAIAAHRGNKIRAPENTMAAFRQALDLGADAIETDVRVSSDGVAYLFHDEELERITGARGRCGDLEMAELRQLDAGSRCGEEYRGEPIPTLAELATLCRGRARLILDLKMDGTTAAIATALQGSGFGQDQASICAWTDAQAVEARRNLPDAPLIYIDEDEHRSTDASWFANIAAAGYHGLSLEWQRTDAAAIAQAHRHGLTVLTWTINAPDAMQAAIAAGVDCIITDDPGTLARLLEGGKPC